MTICLFGLGETGSSFAADVLSSGVEVFAFDPSVVETPLGVVRASHPALAVARAEVVVAAVPGSQAELALLQCLEAMPAGAVYADASQASPTEKLVLAEHASRQGVPFADLHLVSEGSQRGVAMGDGSEALAQRLSAFGFPVEVSDGPVGSARVQRSIERVALAGFGMVLAELLAASSGDERQAMLEQINEALGFDDEHWAASLVEQISDPSTRADGLAEEAVSVASYLRQQGTDPAMIEALAQHLSGS